MSDEFEIDLRKYANWILHSWVWILSLAFIAAVGAFLFSTLKPARYQAYATVVVAGSFENFDFSPIIISNVAQQNYKPYFDLANSGQLKKTVYNQLSDAEKTAISFDVFQNESAVARKGSDESVIIFLVTLGDPEKAAQLANFWAESFVQKANQVFDGQDNIQLKFFQDQLAVAIDTQKKSDQALVEFQAKNKIPLLTKHLDAQLNEQDDYLRLLRNITHLEQNATDLRAKIAAKPSESSLTQAEETSILLMQIQMYNSELSGASSFTYNSPAGSISSNTTSSPQLYVMNEDTKSSQVQINIDSASLASTSSTDALASLDQILKSISSQKDWIEKQLTTLEPRILSLQQSVQTFQNEQTSLVLDQTTAHDAARLLNKKVQEISISLQYAKSAGHIEVISEAITPEAPISRNRSRNAMLAAVVGLTLGILGVFLKNWWQEGKPLHQKETTPNPSFQS